MKKTLSALVFTVTAVLLLVSCAGEESEKSGNKYKLFTDVVCDYTQSDGTSVNYISSSGEVLGKMKNVSSCDESLDKKVFASICNYSKDKGGSLYLVGVDGTKKVAENVYSVSISKYGDSVAYFKDWDQEKLCGTLYVYHDGVSTLISGNAAMSVCLSPDGKSIGYVTDFDSEEGTCVGRFANVGGEPVTLGENRMPVVITDNASVVYFAEGNTGDDAFNLYSLKGGKETFIFDDFMGNNIYVNSSYSELIYLDGETTKISKKGEAGETFITGKFQMLLIPNYGLTDVLDYAVIADTDSFYDRYVLTEDAELLYVDKEGKVTTVVSEVIYEVMSDDGSTIVYFDKNFDMYVYNTDTKKVKEKAAEEVYMMTVSGDGNTVFYTDFDDNLYRYTVDTGKTAKIDENVNYASVSPVRGGKSVGYLKNYEDNSGLFCIADEENNITELREGVYELFVFPESVMFAESYSDGYTDIYKLNDDNLFEVIQENVKY